MNYKESLKQYGLVGLSCAAIAGSAPMIAQESTGSTSALDQLEEILVTGRKREESLQEIPVSITVLGASQLEELNVLRQDDLAALVPGYFYNQGVGLNEDRTAALPSIRGIGSTELATNRSKVASFVDGMPILGSIGAINIGGSTQVEVYSGPQSAAFGRSTFAGAINYVTRDPGDSISGNVGVNWSESGTRILSGFVGGPINDYLGFQLGASIEDSSSPDTDLYSYTDGVEATAETGENLSARLVFTPNDNFKARLSFARDTTDDGPRADFYASAESSFACYNRLNPFTVNIGMGPALNIAFEGVNECELEVHPDTVLQQLNDYQRYFAANPDHLTAIADELRLQGAVDGYLGLTVEEQALIIYDGYSVEHGNSGSESERNRVTAQFDYLFDNGGALQFSIMKSEEDLFRGYSRVARQNVQPLFWNDLAGYYHNYSAIPVTMGGMTVLTPDGRRVPDNAPTTIEENYMELRWASPGEDRLRYVVGASYYDYEYVLTAYGAPGYNTLASGTADLFAQLLNPAELVASGGVVAPTAISSEVTENTAIFFNASYDFTDTLTGSIEGRYASDKVGALEPLLNLQDSVTTNSFVPRLALNWTPNQTTTYYVQYAVGRNPAGINAGLLDPALRNTLDNGVAINDTIYGGSINGNVNTVGYDSSRYATYDEEELTNYEFGFKGTALDGRLTYAGALYYMIWDNALENINLDWDYAYADSAQAGDEVLGVPGVYYVNDSDNTSANQILTNTGESTGRGLELQATYRFTNNWSVSGNFSVLSRKFTDYCSEDDFIGDATTADPSDPHPIELGVYAGLEQGVSEGGNPCWVLDGLKVANQPQFTMTLIPRYRTEIGDGLNFTAAATIRHTASNFMDFANVSENPVFNRVNLNFGLSKGNWSGQLYIDNVLDNKKVIPRRATMAARFFALNAPAAIPPEYQYLHPGNPGAWGSFSVNPNQGRVFGARLNYNF